MFPERLKLHHILFYRVVLTEPHRSDGRRVGIGTH